MLKNYFRVALRNFWRNKTFSLINILGLSIGISASLVKLADSNYFRMYALRLLAGTIAPQSDTTTAVVINEQYLHLLGYQDPRAIIGKQIKWDTNGIILGVVADFYPRSLREPIKPLVIANGTARADVFNIALQPRNADGSSWTAALAA